MISILIEKDLNVDLKEMMQKFIDEKEESFNERIKTLEAERDALSGQLLI